MKRRLLSIVLVICLVLSVMPAYSAFNDISGIKSENDIKILEGLGIIPGGDSYSPESYITRGDFFIMTAGILGYKITDANAAAEFLKASNIVSGYDDGDFRCNNTITYNEALKILVIVLGYNQAAEATGGWPNGYVTTAFNLDIIDSNDGISREAALTRGMAATLMVRAGNTETAQVSYRGENAIFGPIGGGTLFYEKLNIIKLEGVINANSATSITSPSSVGLNMVRIGTDVIDAGNTNAKEYLGYYVEAYCVENEGYTALAVVPSKKKNGVFRISSESGITASGNQISCELNWYTNDGKLKKEKLTDFDVIYNGCAYRGFTTDDFSINSGEIILLDNNADGKYDIVFINEYETYVVDAVNKDDEKVFDKYGKSIELKSDNEQLTIVGADGNYTNLAGIKEGNVLSVMKSHEGDVVFVQVSDKQITGKITSMSSTGGKTWFVIDTEKYYLSHDFATSTHPEKREPYAGFEGVFSLDAEGRIAHIDISTDSAWKFGYIISAVEGEYDGKIYFKLFTTNNKFERFEVVERVIVDGTVRKVNSLTAADDSWMSRQLIAYQTEGNVLKKIDTAKSIEEADEGTLNVMFDIDDVTYNSNAKMFYNNHDTMLGGTDNTIVFQIPTSEEYFGDEKYFSSGKITMFGNETVYNNLDAYNVNEAGIAEVIVRKQNDGLGVGNTKNFVVVGETGIIELNEDGEPVQVLKGLDQTGKAINIFCDSMSTIPADVQMGDVLRYRQKGGVVVSVISDFDIDEDYPSIIANSLIANTGSYYASLNYACGYLDYVDKTHFVIMNEVGTKKITYAIGTATVIIADTEAHTVKAGSLSELSEYRYEVNSTAKLAVISQSGKVTTIIIKK